MKTITTQQIDGFEIITGMYNASGLIDAEATKIIIGKKIKEKDSFKNLEKIKKEIMLYSQQAQQAARNAKTAAISADKRKFSEEYSLRMGQIKELEKTALPVYNELKNDEKQLAAENAVYFSLQPGNYLKQDADAEIIKNKMIEATAGNAVVDIDNKIIPDYRGRIFYKKTSGKWAKEEILKLNIEPKQGSIEEKLLTAEQWAEITVQQEAERIKNLSVAAKQTERDSFISVAMARSVAMRSGLEIAGDKDALKKSQDFYNAEVARITLIYK